MIINHNLGAMNANRNMGINAANANKSMEKLSSGLRINKAGDDAAGLAISEKMRGQIRGLDQAGANAQDGISMVQTAEGALSETHSILQRMRELAVQSGSDTNVGVDRTEIQKEMNQLSSEINRIGNTTEFNTQKVLAGDGKANLTETGKATNANLVNGATTTTEATQTTTLTAAAVNGNTQSFTLNGQKITLTFATNPGVNADENTLDGKATNVTGNSATIYLDNTTATAAVPDSATTAATSIAAALKQVIAANDSLKGNFTAGSAAGAITVAATATGLAKGSDGNIAVSSGAIAGSASGAASVGVTTATKAVAADVVDFNSVVDAPTAQKFAGKGFTVGDKQIEFYNADKGAYTGDAIGVNISGVTTAAGMISAVVNQAGPKVSDVVFSTGTAGKLTATATVGGVAGNDIRVTDGGVQKAFEATLQVGANQGQQFKIDVNDMRAAAIDVTATAGGTDSATGAVYTASNSVTNGTDSTTREAALDVSTAENSTNAVKTINNAIEKVSSERSKLGAFQNRLEHTIANLGTSSENLTSAESRIRDVDMAKEMSTFSKNNILNQAAQAMLAQANQQPQQVLALLR
ncbi:flagellin protein [Clostridium estertheticum]|uniref:flagellin N-terminal helical domain-containing protein n=1 Tax=Clostridium estertheticum TaxID=238834 RepID=UPI001C6DE03B|nr:flagellin [Clostridium estertheticum]MBW9170638.1 flagellin protein [Clostridium estertheticum]WLC74515.1 flagellin protein [Clostridium estertheticum]